MNTSVVDPESKWKYSRFDMSSNSSKYLALKKLTKSLGPKQTSILTIFLSLKRLEFS